MSNLDSHPGEWEMCSVNFYHLKFKASFNYGNTDTFYYLRNPCVSCISSSCVFSRTDKTLRDDGYGFAGVLFLLYSYFGFVEVFFLVCFFFFFNFLFFPLSLSLDHTVSPGKL